MRVLGLLVFPVVLLAQYPPGQYPPNTYPPVAYPPNTYPPNYPNTYPPNTVPGPGGVGIQIPDIRLPGRKSKSEAPPQPAISVASIDGTLRKIAEKELLLEVRSNRVLRFRLLARTQLRDKEGKPVRDSLLHPGDRLTVDTNADDPETALFVTLVRAGTKSERAAAAEAVKEASVEVPEASDLGKPHSMAVPGAPADAPASETSSDDRPVLTRKPLPEESTPTPAEKFVDPVIAGARAAAATFTDELPNFVVQQITTRYQGSRYVDNWRALDVVTTEVRSEGGKEEYRNIRVNGRATATPEASGSWSTGEFSTTLEDIFSPGTAAGFKLRAEDRIANRPAVIYDLTVRQPNSHWTHIAPNGRQYRPAYRGSVWIDKETHRVLRTEQIALNLPRDFAWDKSETILEYGFVDIEGTRYLLPIRSENVACSTGTSYCTRNVIEFRNYRKFTSKTNITFDKFAKSL